MNSDKTLGEIQQKYHSPVAMTLRLSEAEMDELRQQAELEHKSMREIARRAIREYVARRRAKLDVALDRILIEDAELLRRLA